MTHPRWYTSPDSTDHFFYPTCSTEKRGYQTRAAAKRAARHMRKLGDELMSAYRCGECGVFHIGHLPRAVKRGEAGRADIYRNREAS